MLNLKTELAVHPNVIQLYGEGAEWVTLDMITRLEEAVIRGLGNPPVSQLRWKEEIGVGILTSNGELKGRQPAEFVQALFALSEGRGEEEPQFDSRVMKALRKVVADADYAPQAPKIPSAPKPDGKE